MPRRPRRLRRRARRLRRAGEEHCAICLAGNHDLAVVDVLSLEDFSRGAALAAEWTRRRSQPKTREFLLALSPEGGAEGYGLFHASPRDPIWEYVLSGLTAELCFDATDYRVSFIGHSHVALSFHRPEGEPTTGSTRREGDELDISRRRVADQPRAAPASRATATRAPPGCCSTPRPGPRAGAARSTTSPGRRRRSGRPACRTRSPSACSTANRPMSRLLPLGLALVAALLAVRLRRLEHTKLIPEDRRPASSRTPSTRSPQRVAGRASARTRRARCGGPAPGLRAAARPSTPSLKDNLIEWLDQLASRSPTTASPPRRPTPTATETPTETPDGDADRDAHGDPDRDADADARREPRPTAPPPRRRRWNRRTPAASIAGRDDDGRRALRRPLPARAPARRRRHVDRPARVRHAPGALRRGQAARRAPRRGRRLRRALPPRGAGRRAARAPERRAGLRLRHRRGHRAASSSSWSTSRASRAPRCCATAGALAARRGRRDPRAGLPRPRLRAPQRRRAPRRQAGQPAAQPRGRRQARRLRDRQGGRGLRHHAGRLGARHRRLPVARAGARRAGRAAAPTSTRSASSPTSC